MAMACMTRVVFMAFMAIGVIIVPVLVILVIVMRFRMIFMIFVITMFFRMVLMPIMIFMVIVVAMIVRMILMLIVVFVIIAAFVSIVITGLHMNTAIKMFRLSPHQRRTKRRFDGETPLIGKPPLQHHTELSVDAVMLRMPLEIVLKTSMPLNGDHRDGTKLSGGQRLFAAGGPMGTNLLES